MNPARGSVFSPSNDPPRLALDGWPGGWRARPVPKTGGRAFYPRSAALSEHHSAGLGVRQIPVRTPSGLGGATGRGAFSNSSGELRALDLVLPDSVEHAGHDLVQSFHRCTRSHNAGRAACQAVEIIAPS